MQMTASTDLAINMSQVRSTDNTEKIRDHTETAVVQRTDLAVTRVLTIPKTDMGVTEEVILETERIDSPQERDKIQGGDSQKLLQIRHGVIPESIQEMLGITPDKAEIVKIGITRQQEHQEFNIPQ